jgi:hypothetical protein
MREYQSYELCGLLQMAVSSAKCVCELESPSLHRTKKTRMQKIVDWIRRLSYGVF